VNDRIVEVDGTSLQGFTNHEAVEVLRSTGQMVTLRLERYLRGPKFEQLQVAIAASEMKPNTNSAAASPSIMSLPRFPITVSSSFVNDTNYYYYFIKHLNVCVGWRKHCRN